MMLAARHVCKKTPAFDVILHLQDLGIAGDISDARTLASLFTDACAPA
jgi:hypothetical protein